MGHPGTEGCRSKPCSVFCCVSVCIDRAVFASIEDSDSDLDNHGEDSSSNTSADDHMTTKRSEYCLRGAGVKEVRMTSQSLKTRFKPVPSGPAVAPRSLRLNTSNNECPSDRITPPFVVFFFFFSSGVRRRDRPRQQLCVSSLHVGLQQPREAHLTCLPGEVDSPPTAEPLEINLYWVVVCVLECS